MTREEKIICKDFLNDADKTHSCNEYKLLMALLDQESNCSKIPTGSTTRNCFGCKYSKDNHNAGTEECHLCMWENQYTSTSKNDLGVDVPDNNVGNIDDCISRADVLQVMQDNWHIYNGDLAMQESMDDIRALPSVTPQFSSELDKNSKKLEKGTAKDDLVVDWENYKDVDGNCLDDLILEVLQNNFDCGNTYGYKVADEIIGLLPSVTPQPKTGHWIRVTDKTGHLVWECDKCGWQQRFNTNYCPDCGSDNREVVEE